MTENNIEHKDNNWPRLVALTHISTEFLFELCRPKKWSFTRTRCWVRETRHQLRLVCTLLVYVWNGASWSKQNCRSSVIATWKLRKNHRLRSHKRKSNYICCDDTCSLNCNWICSRINQSVSSGQDILTFIATTLDRKPRVTFHALCTSLRSKRKIIIINTWVSVTFLRCTHKQSIPSACVRLISTKRTKRRVTDSLNII